MGGICRVRPRGNITQIGSRAGARSGRPSRWLAICPASAELARGAGTAARPTAAHSPTRFDGYELHLILERRAAQQRDEPSRHWSRCARYYRQQCVWQSPSAPDGAIADQE